MLTNCGTTSASSLWILFRIHVATVPTQAMLATAVAILLILLLLLLLLLLSDD